jgi:hypothetical protein
MTLFFLLVLAAVALGIIGVTADGLGYLLAIGIVLFAADVVFAGARGFRRTKRRALR